MAKTMACYNEITESVKELNDDCIRALIIVVPLHQMQYLRTVSPQLLCMVDEHCAKQGVNSDLTIAVKNDAKDALFKGLPSGKEMIDFVGDPLFVKYRMLSRVLELFKDNFSPKVTRLSLCMQSGPCDEATTHAITALIELFPNLRALALRMEPARYADPLHITKLCRAINSITNLAEFDLSFLHTRILFNGFETRCALFENVQLPLMHFPCQTLCHRLASKKTKENGKS